MGSPKELISVYTSLPPCSRPVYPLDQAISQRWQDTCVDQEVPSKLQIQEIYLWDVEKGTDHEGGL